MGKTLEFHGGGHISTNPGDQLILAGGSTTSVTHALTNAGDGSVTLAGAVSGTINYTGLEPVDGQPVGDRSCLQLLLRVRDDHRHGCRWRPDSHRFDASRDNDLCESERLPTINVSGGTDVVNLNSLAANYAALTVNVWDDTDIVHINGPISLAVDRDFTVSGGAIDLPNGSSDVRVQGSGSIILMAGQNIVLELGLLLVERGWCDFTYGLDRPGLQRGICGDLSGRRPASRASTGILN